jgi:glutathione synthase/RimK-type ligase-like ATP-grasp enzyme
MKIRIVPYKAGSQSAKLIATGLSQALGYKVWRGPAKPFAINISWGNQTKGPGTQINKPIAVHCAADKLVTFSFLSKEGVSHVPYTTSKEVAQGWSKEGKTVFARTVQGQSGSGITIVAPGESMPSMPLYTQYVKKRKEFRVHVVNGVAIDVQQKKKKNGVEANSMIFNHDNGYAFCHNDVIEPDELRPLGIAAVKAVGLDFGAVDIIWNESQNKCYVLEVNTAPGLCDSTCAKYVAAFTQLAKGQ